MNLGLSLHDVQYGMCVEVLVGSDAFADRQSICELTLKDTTTENNLAATDLRNRFHVLDNNIERPLDPRNITLLISPVTSFLLIC